MQNIVTQIAQKSRVLADLIRSLEAAKGDPNTPQEEIEAIEDKVWDLEEEIAQLEDDLEADEDAEREGRHGWA
jgi:predicted  nucleic acid-binding Zn-ribbon protein